MTGRFDHSTKPRIGVHESSDCPDCEVELVGGNLQDENIAGSDRRSTDAPEVPIQLEFDLATMVAAELVIGPDRSIRNIEGRDDQSGAIQPGLRAPAL